MLQTYITLTKPVKAGFASMRSAFKRCLRVLQREQRQTRLYLLHLGHCGRRGGRHRPMQKLRPERSLIPSHRISHMARHRSGLVRLCRQ